MRKKFLLLITFLVYFSCTSRTQNQVLTGLDCIHEYKNLFKDHRIGIITNHTALNVENKHIVDIFNELENVEVYALFGPEHGIRGNMSAGEYIENNTDANRNIPVYSLYGIIFGCICYTCISCITTF